LYEPTWDQVFAQTLEPSCGQGGSSCHAPKGAKGDLVIDTSEASHSRLLDAWVRPGDPGCSLLMIRMEQDDPVKVMPPGSPLSEAERCAVATWIAEGAAR
jgi:hypothetical protein